MNELLKKYNKPAPRYTSYPAMPFWQGLPRLDQIKQNILESYRKDIGIDLYVHVPFCEKLCYYCACNRTVTKNHQVEESFIDLILDEWAIYENFLGFSPAVHSLHFGGGTPTFLSPKNMEVLLSHLTKNKTKNFLGSIEIDPRTVTNEHLDLFVKFNISRVSLGIQDFDHDVQKSIGRTQSYLLVKNLMNALRKRPFDSINFDVIYGLPKQSLASIQKTFDYIGELKPDMVAFFNYAHLPEKIANQRLIKEEELPSVELKDQLYKLGKDNLLKLNMSPIGMDHFAAAGNYLAEASLKNKLHRNFMGYTDQKSTLLIGLGPTAISDNGISLYQNEKNLKKYEESIKLKKLALTTGHTRSLEDKKNEKIIMEIMCNKKVDFNQLEIDGINDLSHEQLDTLLEFKKDKLINFSKNAIEILPLGENFLRTIAQSFDPYMNRAIKSNLILSQTV